MKTKWMIGFMTGCLIVGAAASVAQESSFEEIRTKALEFHRSLIGYARAEVKAKITASAKAAKSYLAECGQKCDLDLFILNDLKKHFPGLADKPHLLLKGLVFAETVEDDNIASGKKLRITSKAEEMVTEIAKMTDEMRKQIMANIRA